ncbi:hypothetical protein IKE_05832 [Bacillus cereus VD196]|uniref:Glycosyl transferase family 1 domain-containing protein n=2 Tax=Bacillus cereus TaxID=1396 RepID=A0A9W5V5Z4_BACCE|nr:hypothetical protein IKG_05601 [Bacillus cereus VD200]EOO61930.1 hypothetical protein IKE_05832 [Bacillus cereus VD196]
MKILLVSERCSIFFEKYIDNMAEALMKKGILPVLLAGETFSGRMAEKIEVVYSDDFTKYASSLDEHRYLSVFQIASRLGIRHVHLVFFLDPQRLSLALNSCSQAKDLTFSYSIFGLAEYARKPIYAKIHEQLLATPTIQRVLLHSIAPNVMADLSKRWNILQSTKVSFVHDPLYDPPAAFKQSRLKARNELNIPEQQKIILYFGTYYNKKGADLLLEATKSFQDLKNVCFLFAGNTQTAPANFDHIALTLPNVRVDDRIIDEETAYKYFVAADLIVQPYRREYEYDTSGVLVQSCLAQRPTVVPDITPFKETVQTYKLGFTFSCERVDSLITAIQDFLQTPAYSGNYKEYINKIESWDDLANTILPTVGLFK